ncbi:MAG: 23S rRNA (uracil(1939)-C(5))-methyltransferase RlmD, partial [Clostridia bacterium]|nr:23S rRNA (uracil(1939)-C(5))-methyltransferase RlmD [Clostridia bacterium]
MADTKKNNAPAKSIRKNDRFFLDVTEMNNLGYGVGHLAAGYREDGTVVFVNGAVTGETVEVVAIKVNKSYIVGKLHKIVTPSPKRESVDLCRAPLGCGGCIYRAISYEYEKELKREYVENCFRREGLTDVPVLPVLSTGRVRGYRNKGQYPVARGKNGIEAGFYAAKSHRLVPATDCALQPAIFASIVAFLCDFATRHKISAYDEESGRGLLRHFYLRAGEGTGEVLVTVVVREANFPHGYEMARELRKRFPEVVGVLLNVQPENTNVVLGDRYILLEGSPVLHDVLCGRRFSIDPAAFWQVNHDGAELLYGLARERAMLTGKETLLDLYCGIGSIGLSMADGVKELIGIEIVPEAVRCSKENAAENGIANASFYCGDASSAEAFLSAAEAERGAPIKADVVIIDPPRKGTTRELIDCIAARRIPRVVYVSCGADTLARDCKYFRECGYEIGEVQPVDLFPRTGHVESVVCLTRKSGG